MKDEYFAEPGPARPLMSTAAIRSICRTFVVLAVVAVVAAFAFQHPDHAVAALGATWEAGKTVVFYAALVLCVLFVLCAAGG